MNIDHEVAIMNAVLDSMTGVSQPILGTGFVSARGRLMGRLNCVATLHQAQLVARRMYEKDGLLVLDNGVLVLNIEKARDHVRHLLDITAHPSTEKRASLRDTIYQLIDKLTMALTNGLPTVNAYQPATS